MAKNYPDQLGDWVRQRTTTTRDRNLVAFLAVRDDVRAALDAGFSAKTVWSNLHESRRIAVGYSAFLRYVHKFLNEASDSADAADVPHLPSLQPVPADAAPPMQPAKPNKPAGFVFNPTPRKEELL